MKFTFTLTESDWEREKRILESGPGESTRHIALKILAYLLYRGEAAPLELQIEKKVGQRHKPDLAAVEAETGQVHLWIDCGQIETERLGRIVTKNPQARIVVVKPTEYEARLYAAAALRDLPAEAERRARVGFVGFDPDFIARLVEGVRGTNHIALDRPTSPPLEPFIFRLNEQSFATHIYTFTAASLD